MNAKELSIQLAEQGAILHLVEPHLDLLVGAWEWLDANRVFYFDALAHDEFGGHVLTFSSAAATHELGVKFLDSDGGFIAYLTRIEEAVDDAEPYRITWKKWQEDRHSMTDFLQRVKQQLLA